jgi:hypothetical protein
MPNVPYPYEVNWQLVTGNGSLTPICSLSNSSISPSLTVFTKRYDLPRSWLIFVKISCFLGPRQLMTQKINIRYLVYLSPKIRFVVKAIFWKKTEKKWIFLGLFLRPNSKLRDGTISHYFV